jgi:hypothetical protein
MSPYWRIKSKRCRSKKLAHTHKKGKCVFEIQRRFERMQGALRNNGR